MANAIATHVASSISLAFSDASSFLNKTVNKLFVRDQVTEESLSNRYEIAGAGTDAVVPLGNINSPTLVIVSASSKFDGTGGTKDNDPAKIQFKIGSGTIFESHFIALFVDVDANTGKVSTDIKITTLANSNTVVEVYVAGAKT